MLSSLMVAASLLGCGRTPGASVADPDAPTVLAPNDVATVQEQAIATGPRISGTLEPADKAVIRAEAGGSVTEVDVELGDVVTEGEILGRIETSGASDLYRSAQVGVSSAEQDLKVAENELARTQRLADAGAAAPRDLELAQSQRAAAAARVEAARAQLSSAGTQLGRTTLRSPMNGVISQRAVNVGDVVAPGASMFTVIEPSSLRLEGSVPASAIGKLTVGTGVRFSVQGYDRTFDGTVERIAPAVDPATRQIPILVSIPNTEHTLIAGLFADGHVATEEHRGLVVPADAVDRTGPNPTVIRVDPEGVAQKVDVTLGLEDSSAERVEVQSGLAAGDIVILGAHDVEPGSKVQVQSAAARAGEG
jgi:RND family efflux transporter MFP subunit